MATNQAKVQCPHCFVQFGFPLPERYLNRPKKNIKFSCAYCTEKFSQSVLALFENDEAEIIQHKIRYNGQNGFQIFSTWDDFRQEVVSNNIQGEEAISAFGESWNPISSHREMHDIFPPSEDSETNPVEEAVEEPVEAAPESAPVLEEAVSETEVANEMEAESTIEEPVAEEMATEDEVEGDPAATDEAATEEAATEEVVAAESTVEEPESSIVDENDSPLSEPAVLEDVEPVVENDNSAVVDPPEETKEPIEDDLEDEPVAEPVAEDVAAEEVVLEAEIIEEVPSQPVDDTQETI